MNPTDDNPPRIDEHPFDLLVDDELSERQRRELLASLDDTPDGWRRCALAFLEAQCLGRELGRISRLQPTESHAEKRSRSGAATGKPWRTLVAMAASFFVALGLGICWQSLLVPDRNIVSPSVELAESEAANDPEESLNSWRTVSFPVSDGSDEVEMVRLPAVERDSIDEAWLMNLPRGMPPEMVRAIEDSGHRIRGQRRLLPLRMKDGRRLVVPVDQVELHYVRSPAYH